MDRGVVVVEVVCVCRRALRGVSRWFRWWGAVMPLWYTMDGHRSEGGRVSAAGGSVRRREYHVGIVAKWLSCIGVA